MGIHTAIRRKSYWCVPLSSVHWRRHAPVYPVNGTLPTTWPLSGIRYCSSSRRLTSRCHLGVLGINIVHRSCQIAYKFICCGSWRGLMRITPCHIGCISPRRQARERRSLQTSKRLCDREANIGLTLHTDFVDPVVSARVSTVGIYAV